MQKKYINSLLIVLFVTSFYASIETVKNFTNWQKKEEEERINRCKKTRLQAAQEPDRVKYLSRHDHDPEVQMKSLGKISDCFQAMFDDPKWNHPFRRKVKKPITKTKKSLTLDLKRNNGKNRRT